MKLKADFLSDDPAELARTFDLAACDDLRAVLTRFEKEGAWRKGWDNSSFGECFKAAVLRAYVAGQLATDWNRERLQDAINIGADCGREDFDKTVLAAVQRKKETQDAFCYDSLLKGSIVLDPKFKPPTGAQPPPPIQPPHFIAQPAPRVSEEEKTRRRIAEVMGWKD